MDTKKATCLAYICSTMTRIIEASDLEGRLDALESAQEQEGDR